MKYVKYENGVMRSDGAWIPANSDNRDWQAYLEWLAEGNAPDEPPAQAAEGA